MRNLTPEEFNDKLRKFRNDNWKFKAMLDACGNDFNRLKDEHKRIALEAIGVQLIPANDIFPFTKIIDAELTCGECGLQGWRYKYAAYDKPVVLCKEHHGDIETNPKKGTVVLTSIDNGTPTFTIR